MSLLLENVLDTYSKSGNPCFYVNTDETFASVSMNTTCHEKITKRIFKIFEQLKFSKECVKLSAVIGSVITPLSSDNSTIDVAIITNNEKLYDEIRNKLYSDSTIDAIIRSKPELTSIDFNMMPDIEIIKKLIYSLRPYLLKDMNKLKVSDNIDMNVYFIIEPDEEFLTGENYYKIIENGKVTAQYISNKKVGYIDFIKDINKKQYYKYIIKPLFNMFKDYKSILNDIIDNNGKISGEQKDNITNLRIAYDIMKNNRFNGKSGILWKDADGNNIEHGYNNKPLDYSGTYSYMNVLYHHISSDLMTPYGSDFTLRTLFDILDKYNDIDHEDLLNFAKESVEQFGKFAAESFLTKKFLRFEK